MNFTAIDFETATGAPNSACAVAIITVENSIITEQYETLIQPPENKYWYRFTKDIHGISWRDTSGKPDFAELYPEIKTRLQGRLLVAHNARFDRNVLQKTMEHHGLNSSDLEIAGWDCTLEIYRAKGFKPANLAASIDLAEGARSACHSNGIRIPDDISLLGCDNSQHAEYFCPPLTVIDIPNDRLGYTAAAWIHQKLQGQGTDHPPVEPWMQGSLIVRETTAPPRKT